MNELYTTIKQFGKVKLNAPLAKFSTFKIGGPADFLITVSDRNKLVKLLDFLTGEGVSWFVLGGGANVLFPDDGFRGVVIKMALNTISVQENTIIAGAGVPLSELVTFSIQQGLAGFEWAAGIPGTLGGAIRGNAGAHYAFTGGEIKDSARSITVWRDDEVLDLPGGACAFAYRDSIFKHNADVILGGQFALQPGSKIESLTMVQKIIEERKGKHAVEPSAGSFFKNIPLDKWTGEAGALPERFLTYKKIAAGWLIEQCGLKGFAVGGAMVSKEHGNFIINFNNASQADVLKVVEEVRGRVYTKFGVELEAEVQIVT